MQLTSTEVINKSISLVVGFSFSRAPDSWTQAFFVLFLLAVLYASSLTGNNNAMRTHKPRYNCIGCNRTEMMRSESATKPLVCCSAIINCTIKQWVMRLMTLTFQMTLHTRIFLNISFASMTRNAFVCIWYSYIINKKKIHNRRSHSTAKERMHEFVASDHFDDCLFFLFLFLSVYSVCHSYLS